MHKVLIIGAGGFGREIAGWLPGITADQGSLEFGGFLDANPGALEGYAEKGSIVADPATFRPSSSDLLVCAIGDPAQKLKVCRTLQERGGVFLPFIHQTAVVGADCRLGTGVIMCPGAVVTSDVTLGAFVTLNVHASVGHDAVIGDGSTLSGHCDVTGGAALGEGVFMGSHATVLPGAVVGEYATVGAGSVVLRRVPAYATVMGVPARTIARRTQSDKDLN